MAEDNNTAVINRNTAKVLHKGRRFSVNFKCPRCRAELESRDADILKTDSCPTCGMKFMFDNAIQATYTAMVDAKQREEKEAHSLREEAAAKREEMKAAREHAEKQRQQEEISRESVYRDQANKAHRREMRQRIEEIGDVDGVIVGFLFLLGVAAVIFAVFGIGTMLMAGGSLMQQNGVTLLAAAVSLVFILPLIAKLFRCLIAIHGLLLRIARAVEKPDLSEE